MRPSRSFARSVPESAAARRRSSGGGRETGLSPRYARAHRPRRERSRCVCWNLSMGRERLDQSRARAIGTNLAADVVAAEVVPAFERRGIEGLVLRGPAIALWLYREGERDYGDVDLLVQAGSLAQAEQILESLGFEGDSLASASAGRRRHAEMWRRGSAPAVDLHRTIVGAEATDADV